MKAKICELCSEEATLFCDSDHAFLCWSCDAKVHSANFLVARHLRRPLCSLCESLAAGASFSGVGFSAGLRSPICLSCSPEIAEEEEEENHSGSDSDSSDCVSSNNESNLQAPIRVSGEIITKRGNDQNRHRALVRVLKNWCARLGLHGNSARTVVSLASHALGQCVGRTRRAAALPVKLALAASFWYGLWCFGGKVSARDVRVVRRIEEITGVSVRLIVTVGLKISGELRANSDLEEGWAESESSSE